jgi:hypothetical protein
MKYTCDKHNIPLDRTKAGDELLLDCPRCVADYVSGKTDVLVSIDVVRGETRLFVLRADTI